MSRNCRNRLRIADTLAGACLGTLPDLDVIIGYGDAVRNFTSFGDRDLGVFYLCHRILMT
jgi:hypothetical protein